MTQYKYHLVNVPSIISKTRVMFRPINDGGIHSVIDGPILTTTLHENDGLTEKFVASM